jgi:glycosyltransferase involved in cell wall biosynthesis
VFAAGRVWDEAKNLAALDTAAAGRSWPVAIAGDTAGPDGGHRVLRQARALGRLSAADTAAWMARAAVFALPARYEPFGLAALEAALAGCALVLGDIPTLRELWDGVAVFVDPDDPAALRRALDGLIADPGRTETLGLSARARALTLSRAAMTDTYLEAYARLTAADAPAAGRAA